MTTHDPLESNIRPEPLLRRSELRRRETASTASTPPVTRSELRRRREALSHPPIPPISASDHRPRDEGIPSREHDVLTPAETVNTTPSTTPTEQGARRVAKPAPARSIGRRIGRTLIVVGTLTVASSFMVGMTIPAETVAATRTDTTARFAPSENDGSAADSDIQAFVVPEDAAAEDLGRSNGYSVTSVPQLAAAEGIRYFSGSLLLDPDAEVQWPFPVSVPTSSSFGPRWGRMHEGADFTPGEGAQIRAVAGGVVRIATENGGAFGVTVYIESKIDGQTVFSRYAHMLRGSLGVREGETVSVGAVVGRVGNTGRSFGAHLHLELSTEDGTVDPVAWLREKTGG